MNEEYQYVVLGAGRQGTAAAYDMARWGSAKSVKLADQDSNAAQQAADRVNKLIGKKIAEPFAVDVRYKDEIQKLLNGATACLFFVIWAAIPISPVSSISSMNSPGKKRSALSLIAVKCQVWEPRCVFMRWNYWTNHWMC